MKNFLSFLFLLLGISIYTQAEEVKISFDVGTHYIGGDTTYNISFGEYDRNYDLFVEGESELEFEINALMTIFSFDIVFHDMYHILISYGETVKEFGGTLRDRDWIYIYEDRWYRDYYINPLMGDTDSDVDSEGKMFDISFKFDSSWFQNVPFNLSFLSGYKMQKWGTFTAKNYEGYYEDLLTEDGRREYVNETFNNAILTYDVEYHILYIGVDLGFEVKNFYLSGSLIIGSVYAEDKDNHILRGKKSESEAYGVSTETKFNAEWMITKNFSLILYTNFLYIGTDGDQDQYWYDESGRVYDAEEDVDIEISSNQFSFGLKASIYF